MPRRKKDEDVDVKAEPAPSVRVEAREEVVIRKGDLYLGNSYLALNPSEVEEVFLRLAEYLLGDKTTVTVGDNLLTRKGEIT